MKQLLFLLLLLPLVNAQFDFQADRIMVAPPPRYSCCYDIYDYIDNNTLIEEVLYQSEEEPVCCDYVPDKEACLACYEESELVRQTSLDRIQARQNYSLIITLLISILPILVFITVGNQLFKIVRKIGFLPKWLNLTLLAIELMVFIVIIWIITQT